MKMEMSIDEKREKLKKTTFNEDINNGSRRLNDDLIFSNNKIK